MDISLSKLPWWGQIVAFVVLACLMIGGFYYEIAMGAQEEMHQKESTLAALKTDINKGVNTARQLPKFQEQVADLQRRLNSLRSVLPEEKDLADLLRRIQTLAAQSNLVIKEFKPSPSIQKQLHAEVPIGLELDGTYHNLGVFFDRIAKFSRIINVSAIDIKAKDKPSPSSTILTQCVATTFVLQESPAKKAPVKASIAAPPKEN
jgi:type IV pilus assembly protein PilO